MNGFSINPNLVVVDRNQASLIQLLEKQGLDVILAALQNVGRGGLASKTLSRFKSRRNRVRELGHLDLRAREDKS